MGDYKAAPFGEADIDSNVEAAESVSSRLAVDTIVMEDSNNNVVVVMEDDADDDGYGTIPLSRSSDIMKANRKFVSASQSVDVVADSSQTCDEPANRESFAARNSKVSTSSHRSGTRKRLAAKNEYCAAPFVTEDQAETVADKLDGHIVQNEYGAYAVAAPPDRFEDQHLFTRDLDGYEKQDLRTQHH